MRIFVRGMSFFIAVLLCAACVFAEAPIDKPAELTPSPALYQSESDSGKTTYVDMARLFNEHPETNPAIQILQNEMDQKTQERRSLTDEFERLRTEPRDSEAAKAQLQKIRNYDEQAQLAIDARQNEIFTPIFDAIENAVKALGAKNGYRTIFVEPRDGAEDVTDAVLRELI